MAQVRKQFEASMGGIVRGQPDWPCLGVKLAWIANLEEIGNMIQRMEAQFLHCVDRGSKKEIADVLMAIIIKTAPADYAGTLKQYDTVQRRMSIPREGETFQQQKAGKRRSGNCQTVEETLEIRSICCGTCGSCVSINYVKLDNCD